MPSTFNPDLCTYATCSVEEYGKLHYIPSLAHNALYLAIFALFIVLQLGLGVKYRTWGYMIALLGGLVLEIVGYASRILLHKNVFSQTYFIMNIVGLTIGPAFFSAAIYLCLARIMRVLGPSLSFARTSTVTVFFVNCDLISLMLQAAGAAITSTVSTDASRNVGIAVMISGLASQVASSFTFICVCAHLAWSIRAHSYLVDPDTQTLRHQPLFRRFLWAIGVATLVIMTRCCYRVAEFSGGYDSSLANNEKPFMALEGFMMIICVTCLTVFHPGRVLGQEVWNAGKFEWNALWGKKTALAGFEEKTMSSKSSRENFAV